MYAAIRRYQVDPGSVAEITRRVQNGFVPLIRQVPGFVDYYLVDAGNGTVVSLSVYTDRGGEEESVRLAAEFVRQQLTDLILNPAEVMAGEVCIHEAGAMQQDGA